MIRQDDFPVLRRSSGRCRKLLSANGGCGNSRISFGCAGLVRIVALQAIRRGKWLPLVSLQQGRVFEIVAVDAQRRSGLRQVKAVFGCRFRARLCASHGRRRSPYRARRDGCLFQGHSFLACGKSGRGCPSYLPMSPSAAETCYRKYAGSWHLTQSRTAGG